MVITQVQHEMCCLWLWPQSKKKKTYLIIYLTESLCHSQHLPFFFHSKVSPSEVSICSLNYCLWSRKDGNQPLFSGVRFRPSPYCPSPSIHTRCRGIFPFRGFAATLWCKATFSSWLHVFFIYNNSQMHPYPQLPFFYSVTVDAHYCEHI